MKELLCGFRVGVRTSVRAVGSPGDFGLKMELALGFRGADERHARILEPPGTESTQLSSNLTCDPAGSGGQAFGLYLSNVNTLVEGRRLSRDPSAWLGGGRA